MDKHYILFYQNRKSYDEYGYKCIDCVDILNKQKLEQKSKRILQHSHGNKKCPQCKLFKPYELFWRSKHTTDGFYSSCIECTKISREPHKENHKLNKKNWVMNNKEHIREYHNNYSN